MLGAMDSPTDASRPGARPPDPTARPPAAAAPSRRRRGIAGVSAGVAEYFNVDPVIVRIAAGRAALQRPRRLRLRAGLDLRPGRRRPRRLGAAQAPIDRKDRRHPGLRHRAHRPRRERVLGRLVVAGPAWLLPLGLMALGAWLLLRRDADDADAVDGPRAPRAPVHADRSPRGVGVGAPGTTDVSRRRSRDPATDDAPGEAALDRRADRRRSAGPRATTAARGHRRDRRGRGEPPTAPWDGPGAPDAPRGPPAPVSRAAATRRRGVLGPIVFGALLMWAGLAFLTGVTVETGLAVGR